VLDEAVLAQVVKAGATILRGEKAGQLERRGDVWQVLAGNRVLAARSVFLATGKHDVRGWKRGAGWHGGLVGFKMHYRLAPRQGSELARAVELSLFPGGYGGLEPVEEGHANLCFLIQRRVLERHGGDWQAVLRVMGQACPSLARRLQDATPLFARPLATASIPYGMVRREARDGVWRLGDQAAVIPSFSGDGMSIALHSASLAARCYGEGQSADTYQRQLARQVGGQVWLATAVSRLLASATGRGLASLALAPEMVKLLALKTRVQERALTV
jgi:flavin-dependent dehydrogenase